MYQITLQYQTNHHYYLNDVTGKHLLLQHNQRQQSIEHQCCCDMGQNDTIGKIELNSSFVLSSDNTNYKNDIQ